MNEKKHDRPAETDQYRTDEPAPKVPGAARRRLLRALGRSSGLTLGVLLTAQWHKPLVKAVFLPAHAQTSPPESGSDTARCPISVNLTFFQAYGTGSVEPMTARLFVNDTVVNSTEMPGATSSTEGISGADNFSPGTYTAGVSVEMQGADDGFAFDMEVSCCDASTATNSFFFSPGGSFGFEFVVSDDGECALV